MTPIVEPYEDGKRKPSKLELSHMCADSRLVIVAGSDTTSATLVYMFNYLAQNPALVEKARKELAPLVREDGTFDNKKANDAQFINGCINEALRLHPPVPTALQRITPPEGITIGDTYIPGDTVVWCPGYVMGHAEENYAQAEKFIPERWSSKPELIKHKNVWFPFSLGTSCRMPNHQEEQCADFVC
jgi:tryprostatin B 6-hydroxylase